VKVAHGNWSTFLAADTAHPDGATSQIDYYHFADALISGSARSRSGADEISTGGDRHDPSRHPGVGR
jgi:hypothetical protein